MSQAAAIRQWQGAGVAAVRHNLHQSLKSAYQARYIVLPQGPFDGSILADLDRRYDRVELARLEASRPALERALIEPLARTARQTAAGLDAGDFAQALISEVRAEPESAFTGFLRATPDRDAHYRGFLLQSSADLLAEASASAFGVIGAFGAPQSALFRVLIDEFGYGAHHRKHSVLFQSLMRQFGLTDGYDAYGPLFDTACLELHNTIHWLFQNPRNVFLQAGFLLFAETAYQRSTADHYRYLKAFHPLADALYFSEHAHIDLHHSRMVIEEVIAPFVASYGPEAGSEIVAGAQLTRTAFERAGDHLLAVSQAFARAAGDGSARYRIPQLPLPGARGVTPAEAADRPGHADLIQVGGLGTVTAPGFAAFPAGAYGLLVCEPMEA